MLRRTPRLKSLTLQVDICNWEPTYDTAVNLPAMCKLKLTFVNRGPDNVEVDDVKTFFSKLLPLHSLPFLEGAIGLMARDTDMHPPCTLLYLYGVTAGSGNTFTEYCIDTRFITRMSLADSEPPLLGNQK
ncbi:hypothetical protein BT96DRAFT_557301 [Gymnopus androsaceus JB14]|uniref:Uncharacterized protein n=1 Tax=Gymnopus androsaceus JB14 TaxID=1447944 RepID=A0A6A4HZX9_9AGAR|nr:hypothetical protein BT96DRAFT_557301 [Gymnopus androsaceus JB14]